MNETVITINLNQIKLLCDAETRKASLMQIDNEHPEERAEASMGAEYSDEAWFSHQCRQGVEMIAGALSRFVTDINSEEPGSGSGNNNESSAEQGGVTRSWAITLNLSSRNKVLPSLLASAMERYLAYSVLTAWAAMAVPSMSDRYAALRQEALTEVKRHVFTKTVPSHEDYFA